MQASAGMETPAFTPAAGGAKPGVRFADNMEGPETPAPATRDGSALRDLLLFVNPALSATVAVLGAFFIVGGHYLISGAHNLTLLTGEGAGGRGGVDKTRSRRHQMSWA